jgi:hypothetical protein
MAYDELWPLTHGQQAGQSETQAEQHRQKLARERMSRGSPEGASSSACGCASSGMRRTWAFVSAMGSTP